MMHAQTNSSRPTIVVKMPSMTDSETLNVVRRTPVRAGMGRASGQGSRREGGPADIESDAPAITVQIDLRPNERM